MRRPTLPLLLAATTLSAVAVAAPQQPVPAIGMGGIALPDQKRTENGLFTIPEQRDAREQLRAVMDYLGRTNIPWDVVTGTAQRLLDAKSDSFYRLKDEKGEDTGTVVSVKSKVNGLLAELPKEGKQFYEQEFGPRAAELLKKAVAAGYDRALLSDVSQRLYHTKAGAQATLLLAALDLDAGRYSEAAYGFQRLLGRGDAADALSPRTLLKAAFALKRSGDARQGEAVAQIWGRLEGTFPRGGLQVGRRVYTLDELRAELDRPIDLGGNRATDRYVSTRLGNAAHTGTAAGGTPFIDPVFAKPLLLRRDGLERQGAEWVAQSIDGALKRIDPGKGEVGLPGFFPLTADGKIVYRGYDGVYAVASRDGLVWQGKPRAAGEILWIADALGGAQAIMSSDGSDDPLGWWNAFWGQRSPGVLFENAQLGSLSHDGRLVYYVDDLAVPPTPPGLNPNNGMGMPQPAQPVTSGKPVAEMQNYSRLHAVDLDTGKLVWTLGGPEAEPLTDEQEAESTNTQLLMENSFFLGPPLAVNGRLFVLYERKGQVRVACLDPSRVIVTPVPGSARLNHYPELLWTQTLGDASTSLRTDSLRRVQPAYLAYADGVLVCPTNCGVVVALDVNARRLLWARYYGSPANQTAAAGNPALPGGGRVIVRGRVQVQAQPVAVDRWRAAAPIIAGGKVVLTAYDSDLLQVLDLRTGEAVWATQRRGDDLYVGGVEGGRVLVVGKKEVRALSLAGADGRAEPAGWKPVATGTPCGHGVMGTGGVYYLPMLGSPDRPDALEPQVWAIDMATGAVASKTEFARKADAGADPRTLLGNLLFQDGQLVSQSPLEIAAFPLVELKRREMAERLKANPNDPEGLLARGELALDAGEVRAAIKDFEAARAGTESEPLRRKLRAKFYAAYTELLRTDFAAGEPYLAEYAALCEVPIDTDVAAERQRLLDERLRRKSLYLTIVARGREKQGRLGEAFDAYRAFAGLGGNRQLVAVAGEPNAETRPDVWARGRIDAMIRNAKDPAARADLEGRVRQEWEELKAGSDLPRLREFVRVFGAYFPAGREAQLTLAERLLATNADDDQREAQTLLMQLWAAAEDPPVAARAVERLARLLTDRGQAEDAVGLYAQLADRFGGVPVRDGKTGSELYAELLTDRRLLPHAEPGGVAGMSAYKVESATAQAARAFTQGFSVQPTGDLFPFYRRFQLSLELNPADNNTWAMRVTDRATGEERCKFTGLSGMAMGPNMNNRGNAAGSLANSKVAQANGQLVLLTMGQFAYCFDLAEKRELWRQNLLGKNPPGGNVQASEDAGGEVVFKYDDGWTFRMARSAVLQQTYVALVTRDGLKAVDPTTGQDLWVRTNLSPKVQVFGDEKHVFVLDGDKSRAFRAIDGMPVEGVPDFAGRVGKPGSSSFVGRLIFHHAKADDALSFALYDPLTGKDVWRRAFPGRPAVLRTVDPDTSGVLNADGSFEAFAVRTGKPVARGQVDADQVPASVARPSGSFVATEPLLLLDPERAYLVLSKPTDGQNQARAWAGNQASMLESLPVNGPVYAFDRASGERLWYNSDALRNQKLILDRFDELPAVVAAATEVGGSRQQRYAVVALDKRTGRLRHNFSYPMNGGEFANAARDPKTRGVEFWRYGDGLRLRFTPDE